MQRDLLVHVLLVAQGLRALAVVRVPLLQEVGLVLVRVLLRVGLVQGDGRHLGVVGLGENELDLRAGRVGALERGLAGGDVAGGGERLLPGLGRRLDVGVGDYRGIVLGVLGHLSVLNTLDQHLVHIHNVRDEHFCLLSGSFRVLVDDL